MDQKLKDRLPQLSLETLHLLDRGKLKRQFSKAIARIVQNICDFPVKGTKVEEREIVITVKIRPKIKIAKRAVESSFGTSEVDVPEVCGLTVKAVVKDHLPKYETNDVEMAVEMKNGQITDARFNPDNSENPEQLELFDDEEYPPSDE